MANPAPSNMFDFPSESSKTYCVADARVGPCRAHCRSRRRCPRFCAARRTNQRGVVHCKHRILCELSRGIRDGKWTIGAPRGARLAQYALSDACKRNATDLVKSNKLTVSPRFLGGGNDVSAPVTSLIWGESARRMLEKPRSNRFECNVHVRMVEYTFTLCMYNGTGWVSRLSGVIRREG